MLSNDLQIKCTCPECSSEFHVSMAEPSVDNHLHEAQLKSEWLMISGKSYRLTWYDCPACGLRMFVQGDDWRTEKLLKKCIDVTTRMGDKSTHRFDNARKQSEYLAKLRNDLAQSRKRVEDEVTGKNIIDRHSGVSHEVAFYHA